MATSASKPEGIGGWLILPAIGLILMPFRNAVTFYREFLPVFTEGHWEILTTPGTDVYHPLWASLIIFEICGNLGFIIFDVILAFLFFRKSSRTPKVFIAFLGLNVAFLLGDYLMVKLIPATAAVDDPDTIREVMRGAIAAAIWIPYFLVSKRVKNTFVN
jgi:hypothetical protein